MKMVKSGKPGLQPIALWEESEAVNQRPWTKLRETKA